MSGFLISHTPGALLWSEAKASFTEGRDTSLELRAGSWRVLVRPRFLEADSPLLMDEAGRWLVISGTCVVTGLALDEGRRWILRTMAAGEDPSPRLRGGFALLCWDGRQLNILRDPNGLFPLFCSLDGSALSTSFLALAHGHPHKLTLDLPAIRQWVAFGHLVTPCTWFEEIRRPLPSAPPRCPEGAVLKHAVVDQDAWDPPSPSASFATHVEWQLAGLRRWFADLAPHASSSPPNVGISGGYDSRLLTLLLRDAGLQPTLHTLVKSRDNADYQAARALAGTLGLPLTEHVAPDWRTLDTTTLQTRIDETARYYDGRPAVAMSLFKADYNPKYREGLLGDRRLSLSGVGGEVFRNYNYSRTWGSGSMENWIAYYTFDPVSEGGVKDPRTAGILLASWAETIRTRMCLPENARADFDLRRRYYGDVWLSDWHGQRNSAENRLAEYLSPFSDAHIVRRAWHSRSKHGVDGAFEAELLRRLDPKVAALDSSYGHGLDRIPRSVLFRSALRCWTPDKWKLAAKRHSAAGRTAPPLVLSEMDRAGLELLRPCLLPLDADAMLASDAYRSLLLSMGRVLLSMSDLTTFPCE